MRRSGSIFLAISLFVCLYASVATADVRVLGSEVNVTFGQAVAEQYKKDYPGTSVDVRGGGKDSAIIALVEGRCDIANSALSLAEEDRADIKAAIEKAKAAGHPIVEIPVAIDGVDFFVNKSNGVTQITLEQLRGIYAGNVTDWAQLGGTAGAIMPYYGGLDDHKTFSIRKWLLDPVAFSPNVKEINKRIMFETVAQSKDALGYDGIYYTSDSLAKSGDVVHSLTVKGPDNAAEYAPSRKYPVSRNLYMFVRQGDLSAEAKAFIDYMTSPKAQRIIGGYVSPLMPAARTFELVVAPKGKSEQSVRFMEDVSGNQNFSIKYESADQYVIYARNNTYHSGSFPVITAPDGTKRNVTNEGLFMVSRSADPKTYDGLMNCNITELRTYTLNNGDVISFKYNGHDVKVTVGTTPQHSPSSSGGCSVMSVPAVMALLGGLLLIRTKR